MPRKRINKQWVNTRFCVLVKFDAGHEVILRDFGDLVAARAFAGGLKARDLYPGQPCRLVCVERCLEKIEDSVRKSKVQA